MSEVYQSATPADPREYTRTYSGFRGVDFSSAITEVDPSRSPDSVNMIADYGGFPQKRTGYDLIDDGFDGRINGIFKFIDALNVERMVVHAGEKIYAFIETSPIVQPNPPTSYVYIAVLPSNSVPTLVYTGAKNAKSTAFTWGGKLYIMDGLNYLVFDGSTCVKVTGRVPTTVIAATPSGGGEDYEPINLISPTRINMFAGTAADVQYQLDATDIDSVDKVETLDNTGAWQTVANSDYSVNTTTGVVTFTGGAPGVSPITGEDNVRITFSKAITKNENYIRHCSIFTFYGSGNDTRVFVSGNNEYKNYDWYSGSNDPTYFPDTQYSVIGADNSAIMGYLKQYSELVIVKQRNDQDATLFLRSVSENADGETIFPCAQGLAGTGAVSRHCFNTLYDDNLFLAEDGVFGLDTSRITLQRSTQQRSYYVNAKLTKEPEMAEAVSCVWNGYYCLFVNGHVYLADSKQRNQNQSNSFGYEWYYWTNVPARAVCEYEGTLYFGTNDGEVYAFKKEDNYFMEAYSDAGEAIEAYWTTKLDDLGDPSTTKSIHKRNVGIVAMPFAKSSAEIYYSQDLDQRLVKEYTLSNEFDFDYVDFDELSFGLSASPYFVPTNKKAKKYKMFRLKIRNAKINEGFGLYKICFNYHYANDIKR